MADKSCLYISHRNPADSPHRHVARKIFDNLVSPAVRSFDFTDLKSHEYWPHTGATVGRAVANVLAADLVVFDLTELSVDGWYNIGLRQAAQLPTVYIVEADFKITLDRLFGEIRYHTDDYENPKLELQLVEAIRSALEKMPQLPGLGTPQKRLLPREMRSDLAARVQEAADAVRLLRINSAADIVADLEKVANDLEALQDSETPSALKEAGEKVLKILSRIADQLGTIKGSRVVIAGVISVVLGGAGFSAITVYGLTLAFWQGPEMFAKAIEALTKRKK